MLIHTGTARPRAADRHLAWSLAAIAGALNAAGFSAFGLYCSNMTGNVSAMAEHLGQADLRLAVTYLSLVLIFVSGAAVSALLINAGHRRQYAGIYALSILAEAVLLACLACIDAWWTMPGRAMLLVHGLSFAMGLQNAVVTRLSEARVRTTHVTGMLTDIGIELGNLLSPSGGPPDQAAWNRGKLRLHGWTVFSFFAGGIIGVVAYRRVGAWLMFAASGALLFIAVRAIWGKEGRPAFLKKRSKKPLSVLARASPEKPGPNV